MAASRKMAKCSDLAAQHTFYPIAVESHDPLCEDAHGLLRDLGRRLSEFSGDIREVFVSADFSRAAFQRCVAARQFLVDEQPEVSTPFSTYFIIFF